MYKFEKQIVSHTSKEYCIDYGVHFFHIEYQSKTYYFKIQILPTFRDILCEVNYTLLVKDSNRISITRICEQDELPEVVKLYLSGQAVGSVISSEVFKQITEDHIAILQAHLP